MPRRRLLPAQANGESGHEVPSASSIILSAGTNGRIKRTTCDNCHDRKVKCDRKRPACMRCQRLGLLCVYAEPDNAQISTILHDLHSRLVQTETRLQERTNQWSDVLNTHVSNDQLRLSNAVQGPAQPDSLWDASVPLPTCTGAVADQLNLDAYTDPFLDANMVPNMTLDTPAPFQDTAEWSSLLQQQEKVLQSAPEKFGLCQRSFLAGSDLGYLLFEDEHPTALETPQQDTETSATEALRYAMALCGCAADVQMHVQEARLYTATRTHLDKWEQISGFNITQCLPALQALVLLCMYEANTSRFVTAYMTISRAAHMAKFIHQHQVHEAHEAFRRASEMIRIFGNNVALIFAPPAQPSAGSLLQLDQEVSQLRQDLFMRHTVLEDGCALQSYTSISRRALLLSTQILQECVKHQMRTLENGDSYNCCATHERLNGGATALVSLIDNDQALSIPRRSISTMAIVKLQALAAKVVLFYASAIKAGSISLLAQVEQQCWQVCVSNALGFAKCLGYEDVELDQDVAPAIQSLQQVHLETSVAMIVAPLKLTLEALNAVKQHGPTLPATRISTFLQIALDANLNGPEATSCATRPILMTQFRRADTNILNSL